MLFLIGVVVALQLAQEVGATRLVVAVVRSSISGLGAMVNRLGRLLSALRTAVTIFALLFTIALLTSGADAASLNAPRLQRIQRGVSIVARTLCARPSTSHNTPS